MRSAPSQPWPPRRGVLVDRRAGDYRGESPTPGPTFRMVAFFDFTAVVGTEGCSGYVDAGSSEQRHA